MKSKAIEPDLGIPDSAEDVAPSKPLITSGIIVGGEPCLNERSFVLGQEFCSRGVIVDECIGDY